MACNKKKKNSKTKILAFNKNFAVCVKIYLDKK